MDERHEFRKINYHVTMVRKVHFLGFGTANDKEKFDLMMGGKPNKPGGFSSQFRHQYECSRPDEAQMRHFPSDIDENGGRIGGSRPCLHLARVPSILMTLVQSYPSLMVAIDFGRRLQKTSC